MTPGFGNFSRGYLDRGGGYSTVGTRGLGYPVDVLQRKNISISKDWNYWNWLDKPYGLQIHGFAGSLRSPASVDGDVIDTAGFDNPYEVYRFPSHIHIIKTPSIYTSDFCLFFANKTYCRSLWILILTETQKSFPHLSLAAITMSLTSSGFRIRPHPIPSCMAHDCGQPQLRSTPSQ